MENNKVALLSAVLFLVISSAAAAGRDVPPVLPKDNVLRNHDILKPPGTYGSTHYRVSYVP
jgi:hypothetical protein